jgi:membrane-anchored protein YejM (alkaline phosphatase superfamily)
MNLRLCIKVIFLLTLISILGCLGRTEVFNNDPTPKVVLIVIDGLRYSEGLGDLDRTNIPQIGQLSLQGTYNESFYNDSLTYTSRAIPALWCGSWTEVRDTLYQDQSTQYSVKPTLFEYFRKQRNKSSEDCFYLLKSVSAPWLPSFHEDYGPDFWPTFISQGDSDNEVMDNAINIIDNFSPDLLWIYLADVDTAGHSGNWLSYTDAIATADSLVGDLWDHLQEHPDYSENTIMFITNDHGRHDYDFSGHGDDCNGCRHIMFMSIGVGIKSGHVVNQYRRIPDFAVTVANIMDLDPEYSTGEVMIEIFDTD